MSKDFLPPYAKPAAMSRLTPPSIGHGGPPKGSPHGSGPGGGGGGP